MGPAVSSGHIDLMALWPMPPRRISQPELPRRYSHRCALPRLIMHCENRARTSVRMTSRWGPCQACFRSMPREMPVRSNCCTERWSWIPRTRWRLRLPPGLTFSGWSIISQERARAFQLAQKARGLSSDPTVLAVIGNALTLLGELDTADV